MTKKKSVRKVVPKTRNSHTMTESAFFSMIRSALRKSSRWWKPVTECKLNSRRPYKGLKKLQKWEYKCAQCNNYFMEKQISVDHIEECGSLNSFEDIPAFCNRLFVEVDGLQVLCKECHNTKTQKFREQIKANKNVQN